MRLFSTGLNHTTATAEVRERFAFQDEHVVRALADLRAMPAIEEAVIISTCNRTEVDWLADCSTSAPVVDWLSRYHDIGRDQLNQYLYSYEGRQAIRHLLRVSSGLDSMVLGEPQILGQLKDAYELARRHDGTGRYLSKLFQHAFAVAKRVRGETRIGANPVSVASTAMSLIGQIFADFPRHTALLLGAGDTTELFARYLHQAGIGRLVIANRTVSRARDIARRFHGYAIALDEVPAHLAEADILVTATASHEAVVRRSDVEAAYRARKHRPVCMVDLSIPRDIEADGGALEDVFLYDIDDLRTVIQENEASRREAAQRAETIIDQEVDAFLAWVRSQDAVQLIRELRGRAHETRRETLDRARRMLARGHDPDEALEFLAHTLTNKLLHAPSAGLREAGNNDDQQVLEAARRLYRLDPGEE